MTCSTRSKRARRSVASPQTVPMITASTMTPSPTAVLILSSRPAKNAKPWKSVTAGAVARNEALRASKYLGRAIWRNWSGYHRRSCAETKMHSMKLLGQHLMALDFDRQVVEVKVRIAVMNRYTALGIPATEPIG